MRTAFHGVRGGLCAGLSPSTSSPRGPTLYISETMVPATRQPPQVLGPGMSDPLSERTRGLGSPLRNAHRASQKAHVALTRRL